MSRVLIKGLKAIDCFLYGLSLLVMLGFVWQNKLDLPGSFSVDRWLLISNFIVLIPANLLLYHSFKVTKSLVNIENQIKTRVGENRYYCLLIAKSLIISAIYIVGTHLLISMVFIEDVVSSKFVLWFSIVKFLIFLCSDLLLNLLLSIKSLNHWFFVPMVINFSVHYMVIAFFH